MKPADAVRAELAELADPKRATGLHRYLRMEPGGYGEGDQAVGVAVPDQRKIAGRHWRACSPADAEALLTSPVHEERLTALFILVRRFQKATDAERKEIYDLLLRHTRYVNNWDLVDSSAPYIVGPWLLDKDRSDLDRLARSDQLWDRRIAIMATFAFIKANDYEWTFRLSEVLINDPHDLIHKAVGWMLREVGNRDRAAEEAFLVRWYHAMPRVMLRYAIEKFPPGRRQEYLTGTL
jgi:3-methyladenine DNA glycosylase AlkD